MSNITRSLLGFFWLSLQAPASALIGGESDAAGRYGAVLALRTTSGGLCTASKIAPRTLLTAAHCVVDLDTGRVRAEFGAPGAKILISNAPRSTTRASLVAVTVDQVLLPPAYQQALSNLAAYKNARLEQLQRGAPKHATPAATGQRIGHLFSSRFPDVAILTLKETTPSIPSMSVNLEPLDDGAEVVLVGYGCRSPGDGVVGTSGTRAWARTRVIRVDKVNFYSEAAKKKQGAPSLCPGDSGGPVLKDGRIVGVHGVVYGLDARGGARSNMAANINTLADWVAWPRDG